MTTSQANPCTELYVYTVRPDAVQDMLSLKDKLIQEAHTLDGLLSSTTFRSTTEPNVFTDYMVWRDLDAATAGGAAFRQLPSSAAFMSLMAGPPSGGTFYYLTGDEVTTR